MATLLFNPEKHEYTLDGARLPSVTQVLEEMGLTPQYPSGPYRVRGQRVHQACCLFDFGELDQYELGADLMPYVERYKRLVADLKPIYELTEQAMYHPVHCYAGTVDRVGRLFNERFVGDIKTGATGPETGLQLAGYAILVDPRDFMGIRRYKFDLSEGDGKLVKYDDHQDFDGFLGILDHWKWLQKKKNKTRA